MSNISPDEKRHNKGLEHIASRLVGHYDAVLLNPTYHVGDSIGELDILAIRGTHATYYEVKCRESYGTKRKARHQLHRVQAAFPNWNVRGVYVPLDSSPRRIS